MALTACGALLLAITHGLAWWYGTTSGKEVKVERRAADAEQRIAKENDRLLNLLQQRREAGKAEQVRKQEQWERERIEAERAGPGGILKQHLAAGRAKLEAAGATAAELEAILEKLAEAEDSGGNVELADLAALELWLDRDAAAALTWLSRHAGYGEHSNMTWGLVRWLGASDCKDFASLLERYPGASKLLVSAAADVAQERGADFTLALAETLYDPSERFRMLQGVVYGKERKPEHLARVLAMQGQLYTGDIWGYAANSAFGASFGEEMRKAGLSEEAIAKYETYYAAFQDERRAAAEAKANPEPDAEPSAAEAIAADLADATGENSSWHSNAEYLEKMLPDFDTWYGEVQDRRMSPQELMAKAKEAWPAAGEHESELRTLLFRKIFNADPLGSMQWWLESGQQGLPVGMDDGFRDLTAEQAVGLLDKYPDFLEQGGEGVQGPFLGKFDDWLRDDPEGYDKALARLQESAPGVAKAMIALRERRLGEGGE